MNDQPEPTAPNAYKIGVRNIAAFGSLVAANKDALDKGWSLSASALCTAIWACELLERPSVVEFGAGTSTKILSSYFQGALDILSIEHDAVFAESMRRDVAGFARTKIKTCPLTQYSDMEFDSFFNGGYHPRQAAAMGKRVHAEKNHDHLIRNTFYDLSDVDIPPASVFILDGPHGNGRALAFPFIAQAAVSRAFVIVDDVNDYDFLWRAGCCFRYNLIYGEIHAQKRWVLLELRKTSW